MVLPSSHPYHHHCGLCFLLDCSVWIAEFHGWNAMMEFHRQNNIEATFTPNIERIMRPLWTDLASAKGYWERQFAKGAKVVRIPLLLSQSCDSQSSFWRGIVCQTTPETIALGGQWSFLTTLSILSHLQLPEFFFWNRSASSVWLWMWSQVPWPQLVCYHGPLLQRVEGGICLQCTPAFLFCHFTNKCSKPYPKARSEYAVHLPNLQCLNLT